jgi:hypothetical protein
LASLLAFVLTRAIRGTVEDVLWGACPRPRCVPFVELSRMSCGVHVPDASKNCPRVPYFSAHRYTAWFQSPATRRHPMFWAATLLPSPTSRTAWFRSNPTSSSCKSRSPLHPSLTPADPITADIPHRSTFGTRPHRCTPETDRH